jgi:hypothetical protein
MPVKDRIVTWFIQHVLVPKIEIIDNPGFVINTLSDRTKTTFLRELFLPERLFEIIETNIVNKHGELGEKILYSCGKKFGYSYASLSQFPTIVNHSKNEIANFIYFFIKYLETLYASYANYKADINNKILTITFKDYIICRNNGLGHIMTEGGSVGVWAYIMQDKSLEAIQLLCQGRGDKDCFILCAPKEKIEKENKKFFVEDELAEIKNDDIYRLLNKIGVTTYAKNSLKDLIDVNFFDYSEGIVSYKKNRFFSCDAHILYIIENEIINLSDGETLLFQSCFEYGKILQENYGHNDYKKFIMDFFPALGFGDIFVANEKKVIVQFYPWTDFSNKSKYIIFRGMLSGFITASLNKTVEFNKYDINIDDHLTLIIQSGE